MGLVEIKWDFPNLLKRLLRHEQDITMGMLAALQTNRGMMFNAEGAYNDHPKWKPLKFRDGMILSDTGALRKSIAPRAPTGKAGPDGFAYASGTLAKKGYAIGSKLKYAAMMNWGTTGLPDGVLKPKRKKMLRFEIGPGEFAFAKQVKIPARRFDRINAEDKRELTLTLRNLVMEALANER